MAKHLSTVRTIFGFICSVVTRLLPFFSKKEELSDIYNFLPIQNSYATSGQPSEAQFRLIRDAGYKLVVNLAPTSMLENSIVNEDKILQELGLNYVHIPVDFQNPTDDDFQAFVETIHNKEHVWVHCAANMRVSAFTYRYRTQVLQEDPSQAMADLQKIWEPIGVWAEFIQ